MLGLATLDQFGFQGIGGNLIIDGLAQRSPEYRQRVLHHEAGHFLVAHQLGIPVQAYSLTAWEALKQGQPGQAGVAFADPLQTGAALNQTLIKHYSTIWMAGIAAEQLVFGNAEGGNEDRQKLATLVDWSVNTRQISRPQDLQLPERLAILDAKNLLKTHWQAYERLVSAMGDRQPLQDCLDLLNAELGESATVG